MQILCAESGKSFSINNAAAAVDRRGALANLRKEVAKVTGISEEDQILMLPNGGQVNSTDLQSSISDDYVLVVYVFNRQLLEVETVSVADLAEVPNMVPVFQDFDLDPIPRTSSIPEQCAAYLHHFEVHLNQVASYADVAAEHLQTQFRVLREMQVQAMALNVALSNLETHTRSVIEPWKDFNSHAHKQIARHELLIKSFPRDMKVLRSMKVHPVILSALEVDDTNLNQKGSATLADFVPVEKLDKWALGCKDSHEMLLNNVKDLAELISVIQTGTDETRDVPVCIDFLELEKMANESRDCVAKLESRTGVLERDLVRIQDIIKEISGGQKDGRRSSTTSQQSISSRTASKSSLNADITPSSPEKARHKLVAIEHLAQIHREDYLPEATALENFVRDATKKLGNAKIQLTTQCLHQLSRVSQLSSSIADVPATLVSLEEQLTSQKRSFAQLLHVHRMPVAYGAGMVEIVRRKTYRSILLNRSQDVAQGLSKFRSQEQKRREDFQSEVLDYIPFTMPGFEEQPSSCEVNAVDVVDTLPGLAVEDLNEFSKELSKLRALVDREAPPTTNADGDSISDLEGSITGMISQIDYLSAEFERIIVESLNPDLEDAREVLKQPGLGSTGLLEKISPLSQKNSTSQMLVGMPSTDAQKANLNKMRICEGHLELLETLLNHVYANAHRIGAAIPVKQTFPVFAPSNERLAEFEGKWLSRHREWAKNYDIMRDHCVHLEDELQQTIRKTNARLMDLEKEKDVFSRENEKLRADSRSHRSSASSPSPPEIYLTAARNYDNLKKEHEVLLKQIEEDRKRSELARQENKESFEELHRLLNESQKELHAVAKERDSLSAELSQLKTDPLGNALLSDTEQADELKKIKLENDHYRASIINCAKSISVMLKAEQSDHAKDDPPILCSLLEEDVRKIGLLLGENASKFKDTHISETKDAEKRFSDLEEVCKIACTQMETFFQALLSMAVTLGLPYPKEQLAAERAEVLCDKELAEGAAIIAITSAENGAIANLRRRIEKLHGTLDSEEITNAAKAYVALNDSRYQKKVKEVNSKLSFRRFKQGDLALFLPTRLPNAWAAFNADTPHYFLRPTDKFKDQIKNREWLVAQILHVEERTVNTKIANGNPFGLANNVKYYLIDSSTWKPRGVSTPKLHPAPVRASTAISTVISHSPSSTSYTSSTSDTNTSSVTTDVAHESQVPFATSRQPSLSQRSHSALASNAASNTS